MKAIRLDALEAFAHQALASEGMNSQNARMVADALITTDTFGVHSHGIKNLHGYVLKLHAGGINVSPNPEIIAEGAGFAIIDFDAAIGMVAGGTAMRLAIEKAKQCGIGYVGVRNSCHFGAAGYYANLAALEGMFGMAMSNGDPVMAPPNGKRAAIGNNPFAYAVPAEGGRTVFLDIALSSAAALKVVMAKERNERVPENWLVDEQGRPTSDPSGFPGKVSLQPMAGHKGYGIAIMVEVLAAVLTGAGVLSQVPSWNLKLDEKNNVGHAFIALDICKLISPGAFAHRMSALSGELRGAPKAAGCERIYMPGEIEWDKRERALAENRIYLPDAVIESLIKLSEATHINLPELFGEV